MQRRAASVYVAVFLLVAAGAYGVIASADAPQVTAGADADAYAAGDTLSANGRTYTVAEITAEPAEEGAGVVREATLRWVNDSARYTATLDNGSTVALGDANFTVVVPNVSDPSSFSLVEARDPGRPTQTVDGTTYVVLDAGDGNRTLVPLDAYLEQRFGPPAVRNLSVGDSLDYRGNETTVADVSGDGVTLAWTEPRANTVTVRDDRTLQLNGVEHAVYFPDNETVVLTQRVEAYESQVADRERFQERVNGLWGAAILGVLSTVLLVGLAFLPRKD